MDVDSSGVIEFGEFLAWYEKGGVAEVMAMFKASASAGAYAGQSDGLAAPAPPSGGELLRQLRSSDSESDSGTAASDGNKSSAEPLGEKPKPLSVLVGSEAEQQERQPEQPTEEEEQSTGGGQQEQREQQQEPPKREEGEQEPTDGVLEESYPAAPTDSTAAGCDRIRALFDSADKDGNGVLSWSEVGWLLGVLYEGDDRECTALSLRCLP